MGFRKVEYTYRLQNLCGISEIDMIPWLGPYYIFVNKKKHNIM